jgi:hypothetical protein
VTHFFINFQIIDFVIPGGRQQHSLAGTFSNHVHFYNLGGCYLSTSYELRTGSHQLRTSFSHQSFTNFAQTAYLPFQGNSFYLGFVYFYPWFSTFVGRNEGSKEGRKEGSSTFPSFSPSLPCCLRTCISSFLPSFLPSWAPLQKWQKILNKSQQYPRQNQLPSFNFTLCWDELSKNIDSNISVKAPLNSHQHGSSSLVWPDFSGYASLLPSTLDSKTHVCVYIPPHVQAKYIYLTWVQGTKRKRFAPGSPAARGWAQGRGLGLGPM